MLRGYSWHSGITSDSTGDHMEWQGTECGLTSARQTPYMLYCHLALKRKFYKTKVNMWIGQNLRIWD